MYGVLSIFSGNLHRDSIMLQVLRGMDKGWLDRPNLRPITYDVVAMGVDAARIGIVANIDIAHDIHVQRLQK